MYSSFCGKKKVCAWFLGCVEITAFTITQVKVFPFTNDHAVNSPEELYHFSDIIEVYQECSSLLFESANSYKGKCIDVVLSMEGWIHP